jgi:glycosyltransferase involved in cell wall biosynthesis/tetratricopeptide (TPR) repeat protein
MKGAKLQVPACYCLHDDHWYLELSIQSFQDAGPIVAFVSKVAWDGSPGDWERCASLAEARGAEVVLGEWPNEELHRQTALKTLHDRGHSFVLTPDGDEIIEPELLKTLLQVAQDNLADRVMCNFDTYWKSAQYVIRPREGIRPLMLVNLCRAHHVFCRDYEGGRPLVLGPEFGVVHHLSYGGPDERIRRKLATWGHKNEVVDGWYTRVWKSWDENHLMSDLHPTHPPAYGWAERIVAPAILQGGTVSAGATMPKPKVWPTVSVVIPLYGGPEDITACIKSLAKSADLLHEVVVVDDCSPDDAADVVQELIRDLPEFDGPSTEVQYGASETGGVTQPGEPRAGLSYQSSGASWERRIRLLRNGQNVGFGATCNSGYLNSSGQVVIFLNSDTVVPRSGLIRLVESLNASGTIGATGPYSNSVGYHQQIPVTYTSLETMPLFAEDFAARKVPDIEVPILVGFCLAVRRSVIEEVGELEAAPRAKGKDSKIAGRLMRVPFDTRYGKGLFEDNDLCYRIQRAGYRIRIAQRSFVHHSGSRSLARMDVHPHILLEHNKGLYHEKWRDEIESGYASHLPGQKAEPIVFRSERHPDEIRKRIKELARQADISLCMIVRDEERVLGDCLASAKDIFTQVIVVDTGSNDRTVEIAKSHGAEVYEIAWPDSFAAARNESIKYAKGQWIYWLDADDTLPPASRLAILEAAIQAPKETVAFVMPVQFVEGEMAGATRVDHVKLFRNLPGIQFEGRIHEQILPSLTQHKGSIGRIGQVVLHSGYDVSEEGQAKKRVRDEKLLKLDLKERPEHPFVLFNLGMTAHYCGDHEEAVGWLQKSLAVSKLQESHIRKIFAMLGVSERKLGKTEMALNTFRRGIEVVGEDPELRFQLAITLSELGRLAEAKAQYEAICPEYEDHFSSFDVSIIGFKRYFNLASVSLQMDNYADAREWLRKAIACSEGQAAYEAAESLFYAAMSREDLKTGKEALDHMKGTGRAGERWVHYYLDYHQLRGDDSQQALDLLVRENPGFIAPRLVLVRGLLERGLIQAANPHLDWLDQLGSAEAVFFRGVAATRQGDYLSALKFMKRAEELDPAHEQTKRQIEMLQKLLASEPELMTSSQARKCGA